MHVLNTGELWSQLTEQTRQATSSGALVSIETEYDFIEDGGVRFMVRIARNLRRKQVDKTRQSALHQQTGRHFNPFLPPEAELLVGAIPPEHVVVLNKFNVLHNHLLIVTHQIFFAHRHTAINPVGSTTTAYDILS